MAIKTIKNKGKRKGGKKSNRRTYKQRGGNINLLVMLTIGMLATLNIIYRLPENNTQYLRKYINDQNIDVQPGPIYLGIVDSNNALPATVFNGSDIQSQLESALKSYPGIKHPVIVTEDYLIKKIEEKYNKVDPEISMNKVLAEFPMTSVVTTVPAPNGGHFYVVDEGTLNGITEKLVNENNIFRENV